MPTATKRAGKPSPICGTRVGWENLSMARNSIGTQQAAVAVVVYPKVGLFGGTRHCANQPIFAAARLMLGENHRVGDL